MAWSSALAVVGLAALGLVILSTQDDIRQSAIHTRDSVLPQVLDQQRTLTGLERLARLGETALHAADAAIRHDNRLAASILAHEPIFKQYPAVREAVQNGYAAIEAVDAKLTKSDALYKNALAQIHHIHKALPSQNAEEQSLLALFESQTLTCLAAPFAQQCQGEVLEEYAARFQPPVDRMALEMAAAVKEMRVMYNQARSDWEAAKMELEAAAASLSTDFSDLASSQFTQIADAAKAGQIASAASIAAVAGLFGLLAFFAKRRVLRPIMLATHKLKQLESKPSLVQVPEAAIRELDSMGAAVESLARAHVELADRTVKLEQEIAQRRQAEEQLAAACAAAEAANRSKSDFLAAMSHELRTPLNAMIGIPGLLEQTPLDKEQRQYVALLAAGAESLAAVIDDILDLTRVEAGCIELAHREFNLEDVVNSLCRAMGVHAHHKGLELACCIQPETPRHVVGDPMRIKQVLSNLLANAVKFTDNGWVCLNVGPDPAHARPGGLLFSVTDTGVGVPEEKQAVIFDRFTQAHAPGDKGFAGAGLGLSVSTKLANLMDGGIRIESREGQGSTFHFTCMCPPAKTPGPPPPRPVHLPDKAKVLVADPFHLGRSTVRTLLEDWGAETNEAPDLPAAARLLQSASYDLAIVESGLEAALQKKIAIPMVIMLRSGSAHEQLHHRGNRASYVIKPVIRPELAASVDEVLGAPAGGSYTQPQSQPAQEFSGKRILAVDDSASNLMILRYFLKKTAATLETAESGEEALGKFTQTAYDLVLMDIEMPGLDGYETTAAMRKLEADTGRKPAPILAVTAHAFEEHKQRSVDAGCTEFLPKPIRQNILLAVLRKYLEQEKSAAPAPASAATGDRQHSPADAVPETLLPLTPRFMGNLLEDIKKMELALESGEMDALRRLAHSAKGSCGTFGLQRLSALAKDLEFAAANGDAAAAREKLEALQSAQKETSNIIPIQKQHD